MLKKNDPLADVVKGIMQQTSLRKQIEEKLHEELGIQSRKQIPHELVEKYDSALAEAQEMGLEEAKDKSIGAWFARKDKRDARQFEKQDERYAAKSNRKYKKIIKDTVKSNQEDMKDDSKDYTDYPHESKVSDAKVDHSKKSDKDYHKDVNEGLLSNIKNRITGKRRAVMKNIDKKIEDKHNEAGKHASREVFSDDILGIGQLGKSFQDLNTTMLKVSLDPKKRKAGVARDLAIRWARKRKDGTYPSFKKEDVDVKEEAPITSPLRKPGQSISAPAVAPSRPAPAAQPAAMSPTQAVVPVQTSIPIKPATEVAKKPGTEKKPDSTIVAPASPSWVEKMASASKGKPKA